MLVDMPPGPDPGTSVIYTLYKHLSCQFSAGAKNSPSVDFFAITAALLLKNKASDD